MVGRSIECPKCKARLKSDYLFCNQCGYRFLPGTGAGRTDDPVKTLAPRIVLDRKQVKPRRREDHAGPLPRRTAVLSLLALMAIVPMTPWLNVFDGTLTVPAYAHDLMFGSYLTPLALVGSVLVLSDHIVPDLRVRRGSLSIIGAVAFAIVLHDYLEALRVQMDSYSSIIVVEPGPGLYLAFAICIALPIVALLPASHKSVRPGVTYAVRPDSPGSDPRAPL